MTRARQEQKTRPKHDQSYRQIFSHAHVVEELLRGFIDKDRCNDVVWRVQLKQGKQWLYLHLLLEFQQE